jgi:hypothetical protein
MTDRELDPLVDELYGLPLERFVADRHLLVRQLRRDGRRKEASRVAALAKPSIVAWAVNQVVRTRPEQTAALWRAGDAVLDAQARVVAGEGSGVELRAAVEAERAALQPLAEAARGLVTGAGRFLAEQHVQALVETLHAAAVDPALRDEVADGRLTRPLRLTGLGAALGQGPSQAPSRPAAPERGSRRAREEADAEVDRRRAAREQRARRQAARRALARAERARNEARARIAEAVRARDTAAADVERARRELEAAQAALAGAEAGLAEAHAELERAEDALEDARAAVDSA